MKIDRVGMHVRAPLMESVEDLYRKGVRVFQCFLGSPKAFSSP